MTKKDIKYLIEKMGFVVDSQNTDLYTKKYKKHNDYKLEVNFKTNKIDYGNKITLGDNTTSNFSQDENFVVLECVNRLLEKGYEPQHLILERKWPIGHGGSGGKSDINVLDRNRNTLIIIECKTWSKEYEKFKKKMQNDGAQLFSYLQQDKNTKFLCLYTSKMAHNEIIYENAIVPIKDRVETLRLLEEGEKVKTYKEAKKKEELFEVWKENFSCYFAPNGIFDDEVQAYKPQQIPIKRKDLKPFGKDEGGKFYKDFLEILRHNNISDKGNAFNKIMSLILCKIVDERKDDDAIMEFQIKEGEDTPEKIQERLQSLYARGMKEFLKEEIVNYTESDIDAIVKNFPRQKAQKEIKEILRQLKFYSNNEFAFKEVHNEKLFLENAKVLNEIITLLQYKKFRYTYNEEGDSKYQKQYLGNFFELLLDSGYKQDEGQYFTPTPLTKFIIWSLPIKEIIEKKLADNNPKFLPYVIDYACGSGHFLTEMIEELQHQLTNLDLKYDDNTNKQIAQLRQGTGWAEEYIYGIEKDYRLSRTSKVALFMHGDGDANIIFGDGLEEHQDKGKSLAASYDIIVANPPYSVHGFKPHIKKLDKKYSLYHHLTDNSSEIEALFVERTAQLLQEGGLAGIILPSSLLTSNSTIYTKTREILLENFEIKVIVECGSETFLATETNTVILFLKRRNDRWKEDFKYVAEDFILYNKKRKLDFADTESMYQSYVEYLDLNFQDYKTLTARNANQKIQNTDWYKDYQKWFNREADTKNLKKTKKYKSSTADEKQQLLDNLFYDKILQIEFRKFYYFLLCHNGASYLTPNTIQKTMIVKMGEGKEAQRGFLGYIKKKGKRDSGLKMIIEDGKHQTLLYDEQDRYAEDKVNTVIDAFLKKEPISLEEKLKKHINTKLLINCIDFGKIDFDAQIAISGQNKINFQQVWGITKEKLIRLQDIVDFQKGTSITKAKIVKGQYPVIAGGKQPAYYHNKYNQEGNVITVSASGSAGYVAYHSNKIFASDSNVLRSKDENNWLTKVIFILLEKMQEEVYSLQRGAVQPHVYNSDLEKMKVPKFDIKAQKLLLKDYEKIEKEKRTYDLKIKSNTAQLNSLINSQYDKGYTFELIESISTSIQYGLSQKMNIKQKGFKIFRMNEIIKGRMFDNGKMKYADIGNEEFQKYQLKKGDILFNRTNSFKWVGKTGIFDLDGDDYCFASYLVRVEIERKKANPWFVNLMMNSENFQSEAKSKATKSINQSNINAQKMASIKIPLPDLKEQDKIAKQADKIQKEIIDLESKLNEIPNKKEAILKKYLE